MKALILSRICELSTESEPLEMAELPVPSPRPNEILIKISCCGICHTELDEIEGRTPPPHLPMTPGHQVVGRVEKTGKDAKRFQQGDRVGVAWIFHACGSCEFCQKGLENLCSQFKATGRDAHGGYAEYMTVDENFAHSLPSNLSDTETAPLLCAGAIGYRSLRLTHLQNKQTLGLTGFGASGHLVLKMVKGLFPRSEIFVFARNLEEQDFARSMGAAWAGDIGMKPPVQLDAIIDTTPAWKPPLESLKHLKPGGRLIINAIRKESHDQHALMGLSYEDHLWMEKEIKSVANITRQDVREFLALSSTLSLKPQVEIYPFASANRALLDLKYKQIRGAKVIVMV